MKRISPLGIFLGVLATQGASYVFGFVFAIACFIIYRNQAFVAFLEYPSSIAITLGLGLVSTAIGGFIAVVVSQNNSLVNAIICGAFTLVISIIFLYVIDFKYAISYRWMLMLYLFLTIPSAYLGGYVYMVIHNKKFQPARKPRD